jgi:hypothetical protein
MTNFRKKSFLLRVAVIRDRGSVVKDALLNRRRLDRMALSSGILVRGH